jgi:hypothetical protein
VHPNVAAFGPSAAAGGDLELLQQPMGLRLLVEGGAPVALAVQTPAAVVGRNATGVYWEAVLAGVAGGAAGAAGGSAGAAGGGAVSVRVLGSVEYDSFFSYALEISGEVQLSDVQVRSRCTCGHAAIHQPTSNTHD